MGCSVSDLRHCCNCFRLAVYHGGFQDQWVNQRLKVRKARFTWHAMNSLKFYKLFLYKFITTTTPPGKSRDKTAKLFFSPVFEVRKKEKPAQSSKRQRSRSCRSRFPQAIMALYLLEGEEQNRHQVSLRLLVLNSYMYFKRSCEFYLVIGIPAQDRCKMPMGFLPVWEILSEMSEPKDLYSSLIVLICSKDSRAGLIEGRRKFPQAMTTLKEAEIMNKAQQ